jgi:hypothetical protein
MTQHKAAVPTKMIVPLVLSKSHNQLPNIWVPILGGVKHVAIYVHYSPDCVSTMAVKEKLVDCFVTIMKATLLTIPPVSLCEIILG